MSYKVVHEVCCCSSLVNVPLLEYGSVCPCMLLFPFTKSAIVGVAETSATSVLLVSPSIGFDEQTEPLRNIACKGVCLRRFLFALKTMSQ